MKEKSCINKKKRKENKKTKAIKTELKNKRDEKNNEPLLMDVTGELQVLLLLQKSSSLIRKQNNTKKFRK